MSRQTKRNRKQRRNTKRRMTIQKLDHRCLMAANVFQDEGWVMIEGGETAEHITVEGEGWLYPRH